MERLGLSYEELKKIKPDLIVASITGYGHTGPQKDYMGYGPAMAPLTGLSSLTGYTDGLRKRLVSRLVIRMEGSMQPTQSAPRSPHGSVQAEASTLMCRCGKRRPL